MKRRRKSSGRRGLTSAQQAAHEKAFSACNHTLEGNFSKGAVICDGEQAYKIVTYGIRYHEDVGSNIYGVTPCRPKGWKETCELRNLIDNLPGHKHDKDSRGGWTTSDDGKFIDNRVPMPAAGDVVATWGDHRPESPLASFPRITVYANHIIRVEKPNYDDSPTEIWSEDAKLAKRVSRLIAKCPKPVGLRRCHVKERRTKLRIEQSHERYAAYEAARDATVWTDYPKVAGRLDLDADKMPVGIEIPKAEYERIKAELDANER